MTFWEINSPLPEQPSTRLPEGNAEASAAKEEGPNYKLSGKLAADQNTFKGVVLKYSEPPEARKPTKKWRLYVFKNGEEVDILKIHQASAYLVGRDRNVCPLLALSLGGN